MILTLKDQSSQVALVVKNLSANVEDLRDVDSIPRSGCIPGVGNGNPLQYSCPGKFHGQRIQWGTVHVAAKSQI